MATPERDPWHFPRPSLAKTYLDLFSTGPGGPLTLFSPRRTGKTRFLLNDLLPAAHIQNYLPIYVDLWQDRDDPMQALLAAFEEAIDQLTVPKGKLRSRLATTVKKVSALGTSIDFGDEPSRKRPDSPYLLLDFLLKEIVRRAKKPVLLLLDEIQQLADNKDGEAIVAALRSTLTKHHGQVFTLFTGSSEQKLRELFARSRAPLYEFSSHIVFPYLGDDFVQFIANKYRAVTKLKLDESALREAFVRFDHRPKPFVDMVVDMMKQGAWDVGNFAALHLAQRDRTEDFAALWRSLRPLEQEILRRIVAGQSLSSSSALADYAQALGLPTVSAGSVDYALNKLRQKQIVVSTGERGVNRMELARLSEWIKKNNP